MRDDTAAAVHNPALSAGVMLLVGALLRETGLTEFTMDSETFPLDTLKGMQLERDGTKLTVRIMTEGEE